MKRIIFALVISMVFMTQAFGAMLLQGTRQLGLSGRLDQTEEINFDISAAGGYFFQDNIELGLFAGFGMEHGGDSLDISAGGFCEFNIPLNALPDVVPYFGGSIGIRYRSIDIDIIDESDTALQGIGWGGIKYFVVDNLSIGSALRLFVASDDIYLGDEKMESVDWDIIVSTSFYF
jgi:hypothetical protein